MGKSSAASSRAFPHDPSSLNVEEHKRLLTLGVEKVHNVNCHESAGSFTSVGYDNSFSLAEFQKKCRIVVKKIEYENPDIMPCMGHESEESSSDEKDGENAVGASAIEFDLIGIDPPLANSLRRILLAEIPTIAVESVKIFQNTGVLHDEYVAHRLGLVPLRINPADMDWVRDGEEQRDGHNLPSRVRFRLHAKCDKSADLTVYSSDLKWDPETERERNAFSPDNPPRVLHGDIILARLARNQEIYLECWAVKGVGKDHAKWSPVGTAWYRLLPQITLTQPVYDEEAEKLINCCGDGVFRLIDEGDRKRAVVGNTRDCLHSRECLDPERGVPGKVKLQMVKDHFIFRIEAIGQIPAEELFERALGELATKCKTAVDMLRGGGG